MYQQTKTNIMKTIYIHEGVAYLSKDLAILNGADKLSLHTLQLNETINDDLIIDVYDEKLMQIEDYHENQIQVELNQSLEYLAPSISFVGLSQEVADEIEGKCSDFAVDYIFDNGINLD